MSRSALGITIPPHNLHTFYTIYKNINENPSDVSISELNDLCNLLISENLTKAEKLTITNEINGINKNNLVDILSRDNSLHQDVNTEVLTLCWAALIAKSNTEKILVLKKIATLTITGLESKTNSTNKQVEFIKKFVEENNGLYKQPKSLAISENRPQAREKPVMPKRPKLADMKQIEIENNIRSTCSNIINNQGSSLDDELTTLSTSILKIQSIMNSTTKSYLASVFNIISLQEDEKLKLKHLEIQKTINKLIPDINTYLPPPPPLPLPTRRQISFKHFLNNEIQDDYKIEDTKQQEKKPGKTTYKITKNGITTSTVTVKDSTIKQKLAPKLKPKELKQNTEIFITAAMKIYPKGQPITLTFDNSDHAQTLDYAQQIIKVLTKLQRGTTENEKITIQCSNKELKKSLEREFKNASICISQQQSNRNTP